MLDTTSRTRRVLPTRGEDENRVTGVCAEFAGADLPAVEAAAGALAKEVAGITDAMAGLHDPDRARLWMLASECAPERLGDLARGAFVSATVTAFGADLLADDAAFDDEAWMGLTMLGLRFSVPAEELEGFDRWYDEEHTPQLLAVPGWLRVRRFALGGCAWNRLTVHDIAHSSVVAHDLVQASMQTPRRRALAERPWFHAGGRAPLARLSLPLPRDVDPDGLSS